MSEELPNNFLKILIASEILIPAIIFIGAYFIFKPVFGNKKKDDTEDNDSKNEPT
jgi:hypothetical protein